MKKHKITILSSLFSKPYPLIPLLLLAFGLLLAGCSAFDTTSNYYYYPDWTPNGDIICMKLVRTNHGGSGGMNNPAPDFEDRYFITTMDVNGNNEREIKQVGTVGRVAMSPLCNYIAYTQKNSASEYNGSILKIIAASGNEISTINGGGEINSFDWSPDENKVVYNITANGTKEGFMVNKDGSNVIQIPNYICGISWRFGQNIIISGYSNVFAYNINTSIQAEYPKIDGWEFSVNKNATNEIICRSSLAQGIKQFDLNSPTNDPVLLINSNDIYSIHLSPDGQKIVGTGTGSQFQYGQNIWLINIDGTGKKLLK